jgi:hypothetical protein
MTDLRAELQALPPSGVMPVGLPSGQVATQLFDQVKDRLWAAA